MTANSEEMDFDEEGYYCWNWDLEESPHHFGLPPGKYLRIAEGDPDAGIEDHYNPYEIQEDKISFPLGLMDPSEDEILSPGAYDLDTLERALNKILIEVKQRVNKFYLGEDSFKAFPS